jgi:dipeptidyl aminopeptidase/acylaminoacyl peptidase
MRGARVWIAGVALVCAVGPAAGVASANFPGTNGKLGFSIDAAPGMREEIATIDPDGLNRTIVTGSAEPDYEPSFSSDGERIVFIRNPQPSNAFDIWTMNADGTGQTQLTAPTGGAQDLSAEFSPDGQWIVFDRYNGTTITQVWIMRSDGSEQRQLTFGANSRSPSFSPSGDRIVFSRDASPSGSHIWTMDRDGGGQVQLTDGGVDDSKPSFSPDEERIVFLRRDPMTSDGSVWITNADGSGETPVTSPTVDVEGGPVFSPDGTRIAFDRFGTGQGLYLVNPDGGNLTPVPNTADAYGQSSVAWQPLNPPVCDLTGPPKQNSFGAVTTTISCSEDVTVQASGEGKAPKAPKLAVASKPKKFTLEPTTLEVQPGQATTLTLTVPKKGKKALKKAAVAGKKGKATVTTTATDDLGESTQDSLAVKFKKKKKK